MKSITIYRVVRLDGQYDPASVSMAEARETILDAFLERAENGTRSCGVPGKAELTGVADCGESQ